MLNSTAHGRCTYGCHGNVPDSISFIFPCYDVQTACSMGFKRLVFSARLIPRMSDIPKIALLVDTSYGVRRDMLLGITRFVRQHGPWSLFIAGGEHTDILPKMQEWGGHGIIARIPDERTEQAILEAGLPTISLCLSERQQHLKKSLPLLSNVSFDAATD